MTSVISVENLSKSYKLGQINTGTFTYDLQMWWARVRGKPSPSAQVRPTPIKMRPQAAPQPAAGHGGYAEVVNAMIAAGTHTVPEAHQHDVEQPAPLETASVEAVPAVKPAPVALSGGESLLEIARKIKAAREAAKSRQGPPLNT